MTLPCPTQRYPEETHQRSSRQRTLTRSLTLLNLHPHPHLDHPLKYSGDYKYYMDNKPEVAEQVKGRFVKGDARAIGNAKVVDQKEIEDAKRKKKFGGGGGPSGNKNKGVKNAKRMNN